MRKKIRVTAYRELCGITEHRSVIVGNRRDAAKACRWAAKWGLTVDTINDVPAGTPLYNVTATDKRDDLHHLRTLDEVRALAQDSLPADECSAVHDFCANPTERFQHETLDQSFVVEFERAA